MKTDDSLQIIDDLLDDWYARPLIFYTKKKPFIFAQQSYARQGLLDLRDYIYQERFNTDNIIDLIGVWRDKMNDFSCLAKTPESTFIFSVYFDVANDVLDHLIV